MKCTVSLLVAEISGSKIMENDGYENIETQTNTASWSYSNDGCSAGRKRVHTARTVHINLYTSSCWIQI